MLRNQKYRKCKKCGQIGGDFVTRKAKLASGRIVIYPENKCNLCANEESRERNYKLNKDPEWRKRKRLKLLAYKRSHKKLIKKQAHNYWLKNREEISKRRKLRKEIQHKKRKKNAHHRVPAKDHPLREFNFRSVKTMRERINV